MAQGSDDENPFADMVTSNQFYNAGPASENRVVTGALDSYNPFEASTTKPSRNEPNSFVNPPPYSAVHAQKLTVSELERRQKELDDKAAELSRREEEQRIREERSRSLPQGVSDNNWPPLPKCLPFKSCFYQNIEVEIIPEYQKIVRTGYYIWLLYAFLWAINLINSVIYFAGTDNASGGTLFGVSIVIFIICIPSSYVCWFRPLYKAFRNNSSINFFIFFVVFAAQILVLIIQSIGISSWGACGWLIALAVIKNFKTIGIITMLVAASFTGLSIASTIYLIRVHRIYRSTGASFGKAKEEFAHGLVTDPYMRSTAIFASRQAGVRP